MVRLSDPHALVDQQFRGGVLEGFSGGPVMVHVDRKAYVIGLATLGGEKSASSRMLGSDEFLGFLDDHDVSARRVSAKDVYSVVGWRPIVDAVATLKQEKIPELLTWTGRLTKLVGRPLQPFIDWAEKAVSQDKVCCKVIAGEGGLGKTRYAFEGADFLSRAGWQVGLIQSSADLDTVQAYVKETPNVARDKALLVVDYAERFREKLGDFLRTIQKSDQPVAVVLLSRHGQDYWDNVPDLPNASLCELTVEPFAPLSAEESHRVLQHVLTRLNVDSNRVPLPTYLSWLNPEKNVKPRNFLRCPLFILGVGICLKLNPEARFQDLTQRQVIDSLVAVETKRLAAMEDVAYFPPASKGLTAHLQMLAILTGTLDTDLLSQLAADPSLCLGFDGPHTWEAQLDARGVDCLHDGAIKPITPDLFAAGLAYSVLATLHRKNPKRVPQWLAVIADHRENLEGFLEQFAFRWHDLWALGYGRNDDTLKPAQIEGWLEDLFRDHVSRCRKAESYFSSDISLMPKVGAVVYARLVQDLEESAARDFDAYGPELARRLNNLSIRLAEAGERAAGLAAIQRAVAIRQSLAADNFATNGPDLASSLGNLAIRLTEAGEREAGLVAIRRAAAIYEPLAAANFAAYGPALASSLNNLSVQLAMAGERIAGLAASERAVDIHESLAAANFATFGPELATSLNTWSIRLAETGKREAGLAVSQRALEIRETLAAANFATYGPDLASSLNNLSVRLAEVGAREAGLAASQRAVDIYESLAAANFAAYGPDLARGLNNWSIRLAETGARAASLAAIQRVVALYETLATANFAAYSPDLASSLHNWSTLLAETGEHDEGLVAIQRAVAIRESLAAANFAAYGPALASSLNNLSNRLVDSGARLAGLAAIRRAVAIREALAEANFAAYGPNLASSLNNLSNRLADAGERAAGLAAIQRAVAIFESLAAANFATYGPDLLKCLQNLSIDLANMGDQKAAHTVRQRSDTVRKALAQPIEIKTRG